MHIKSILWLKNLHIPNFCCTFAATKVNEANMEAVMYSTAEEKRSARNRLIVIKTAIEEQMRQRMTKMEW